MGASLKAIIQSTNYHWLDTQKIGTAAKLYDTCDFSDIVIGNISFANSVFIDCNFTASIFDGTNFNNCTFISCTLTHAVFKNTPLNAVVITGGQAYGTVFSGIAANNVMFNNVDMMTARFPDCTFTGSAIRGCKSSIEAFNTINSIGIKNTEVFVVEKIKQRFGDGHIIDTTTEIPVDIDELIAYHLTSDSMNDYRPGGIIKRIGDKL